jgi:hypothetical protein
VAEHVDPLRVDRERRLDLGDDARQVGRVVDALAIEVTAGVGRVPEPASVGGLGPVRVDIQ